MPEPEERSKMKNNLLLIIGSGLLLLIPLWIFLIVPELEKIDSNYIFEPKIIASENSRFEITGRWSGKNDLSASFYEKITKLEFNNAVLETRYTLKNQAGETSYNIFHKFIIDRKTRHNLAGETDTERKSYASFPLHVKKQTYNYWPVGYGQSFDLKFKGIEDLYGLKTYHFEVLGKISDDTRGYDFHDLVPEKYKGFSNFDIHIYVEPVSGVIVNYEDEGRSYYVEQDGTKVQDFSEWENRFDYYTIKSQAEIAKSAKLKIYIYKIYIPLLLSLAGLGLLGLAWVRKKKK